MTVIDDLKNLYPDLTKSERKVAEYIIHNPVDVVRYYSSDIIASLSNSSRASLVRLCQKLGFKGFSEFKYAMARELTDYVNPSNDSILDYYIKGLVIMKEIENGEDLKKAAKLIKHAQKIYAYGNAHSQFAARQFMYRMARNNYSVLCLDQALQLEDYLNIISVNDIFVLFSISGGNISSRILDDLERIHMNGTRIILVTMTKHPIAEKYADAVICLPCVSRLCTTSIIDDASTFCIGIELLIEVLCHKEEEKE